MSKMLIIDANSIANRAFYAMPLLNNGKGIFTNAVYGVTNMLWRLLDEEKPDYVLMAFDAGKVTFRTEAYAEYKGTRAKTPTELSEQFPLLHQLCHAMGIAHYELPGYEADDIIGTMSRIAEERDLEVLVLSGDKDLLQLVSPRTRVALTRKGISETELYDEEHFSQVYEGLRPLQMIDLKGLMGDTSDNIPGIPGVGEKTALKLLKQFGSVEEVLANWQSVSGKKLQEKIAQHQEEAKQSKWLATIQRDIPLTLTIDDVKYAGYNPESLRQFFEEMEFNSFLQRLPQEKPSEGEAQEARSIGETILLNAENCGDYQDFLQQSPLALYLEMDGENYHRAAILGLGISDGKRNLFVPTEMLDWQPIQQWLADGKREKWVFDGKKLIVSLGWRKLSVAGISYDLLLASYLCNPSESQRQLLDVLHNHQVPTALSSDEEIYGKGAKWQLPSLEQLMQHVALKAEGVYASQAILHQQMEELSLLPLYEGVEQPCSLVLAEMEQAGVLVDVQQLAQMGQALQVRLDELTNQIYALAGTSFNINSPKQLGEILFDKMGLPVLKKTKTGYSTSADVLEKLEPYHEIISLILTYRQLIKLQSTYIEGLQKEIHPISKKVHTIFQQAITATGRLSSTDPNLQNIPIRLEEGRKIRQAFIPSQPGWKILSADYSQIELRVLAHISQDANLIDAFLHDMDIHTRTAMDVFSVPKEEVDSNMRRQAKAVNFGIVYGISDYGLSQNLNIPRKQAAQFIDRYFAVFPGVKQYMESIVEQAKQDGYVTTLLQRRRYLPEIHSRNFNLRSFAERTAMNTPIQGSAADIIKLAMLRMAKEIKAHQLESCMLLQVHDELIFEVAPQELEQMKQLVREVMEHAMELAVPLKVDVNVGDSWYEAK